MFDFVARVLALFYDLPVVGGNYGLAIMMLTIAVMILLMPLTLKATRSTIKMQQVQPELKRIQKEHKGDRETMNQELMALYQENGINPVGGCVPMLAQLPVFLVLFNVLRGLTRRVAETPWFTTANQIRELNGLTPVGGDRFEPKYLDHESQLYLDLKDADTMSFGPFDLAAEALDVLQDNFLSAIPYVILILFVVATSFYQQRQVSARRGNDASPMNSQQQMLLRVLPLMSGIWSFLFPAGLVLYWATSNVFRIGQQAYITRQIYGKEGASDALAAAKAAIDEDPPSGKDGNGGGAKGKGPKSGGDRDGGNAKKKSAKGSPADGAKQNGSNGSKVDKGGEAESPASRASDKAAEWERRRAQKAKTKASSSNDRASSRVTPKGTSPTTSKKKRKR